MPRELLIPEPERIEVADYDEPELGREDVRLRSIFASNKHGTLFRKYRGDPNEWKTDFERTHRISFPQPSTPEYPLRPGNITVGEVLETGDSVRDFREGDRVFGWLPIRDTHTVPASALQAAPDDMAPEAIVYTDPAAVGVHLVRDGDVSLGDTVGVFGAGAIGQMAAQLARVAGARAIAVSDPIVTRRTTAADHGADLTVDPTDTDAALVIKTEMDAGDEPGVDRALETSAAYGGLNDAVRAVAYGGTVASCGYYEGEATDLALEAEFHRNAVEIRSVQPGSSDVMRFHPRWSFDHLREEAFRHLREGTVSVDGLVDPVVPFDEAAEAIEHLEAHPEEGIKLGVTFAD